MHRPSELSLNEWRAIQVSKSYERRVDCMIWNGRRWEFERMCDVKDGLTAVAAYVLKKNTFSQVERFCCACGCGQTKQLLQIVSMMDKSHEWLIAIQLLLNRGMVPSVKIYLSGVCRVLYYARDYLSRESPGRRQKERA